MHMKNPYVKVSNYLAVGVLFFLSFSVDAQSSTVKAHPADSLMSIVRTQLRTQPDSAIFHAHRALNLYLRDSTIQPAISACLALSSLYYYSGQQIIKSKTYAEKALALNSQLPEKNLSSSIIITNNLAILLNSIGNYVGVTQRLEDLLVKAGRHMNDNQRAKIHINLGANYSLIRDYDKAQLHYATAMALVPEGENQELFAQLKLEEAYDQQKRGNARACIKTLETSWEVIESGTQFDYLRITFMRILGTAYTDIGNFEKAHEYLNKALFYCGNQHAYHQAVIHRRLGQLQQKQGKLREALIQFETAEQIATADSTEKNRRLSFYALSAQANVLHEMLNHDEALKRLGRAQEIMKVSINDTSSAILNKPLYRENLYLKARILEKLNAPKEEVLESYNKAIQMIFESRKDINTSSSRIFDVSKSLEVFERAIAYAVAQYEVSGREEYLWRALYWSDISKSMTLNEDRNRHQSLFKYAHDTIFSRYADTYADLQLLYMKYSEQGGQTDKKSQLAQEILDKQLELKKVTENLDLQVPSFEDFVERIQGLSFVEIFSGEEYYYFFTHQDELRLFRHKKSGIDSLLGGIIPLLDRPNVTEESKAGRLDKELSELKKLIFGNVVLSDEKMTAIVPDGSFFSFPFGLLLGEENASSVAHVFYTFSLNALTKPSKTTAVPSVLTLAPSFNQANGSEFLCDTSAYTDLDCNVDEVSKIAFYSEASILKDDLAARHGLEKHSDSANIVHFATHACIDKNNYYNSHIALSDGALSLADLYHLNWPGKSVVLSACSTADGKVVPGEGVFSLARTLLELGSREVLVSLWPVDDCASAELLPLVYKHYDGSFTEALSLAKNEYLSVAPDHTKHPYYWSSFIVFSTSMESGRSALDLFYWVGGLFILLIMYLVFRSIKF